MHEEILDREQIATIVATVNDYIARARKRYRLKLATPDIRFDVHGSAWGYYVRSGSQRWFRFNPTLFARHFEEGLNDTIRTRWPTTWSNAAFRAAAASRTEPSGAK